MNLVEILVGIAYDEYLIGQLLISEEGIHFEILGHRAVRFIWGDETREYQQTDEIEIFFPNKLLNDQPR